MVGSKLLGGSMKKFIQENPTIAYGLGLPLLLVVVFLIVSGLPQLLVANPQYELLYATGTHNYPNVVQINVVEQKVQVIYQGAAYGNERPRLWRYNPQSGGVQEIAIILPPNPVSSILLFDQYVIQSSLTTICKKSVVLA
jgi:hypothetical protein